VVALLAGCESEPVAAPQNLTPAEARGQRIYAARCAVCHDPNSTKPRKGPGLKGMYKKPYLPSGSPAIDARVRDAILLGRPNMGAFNNLLDEQQLSDLLAYLHTL